MPKMRTPKTKTPKPKTEEPKTEEPKKTRNVKKDTPEIIDSALLAYSAVRVDIALVTEGERNKEMNVEEVTAILKHIRRGQMSLQGAHATISYMRNTPWRESMLSHLAKWDKQLDNAWQSVIEDLDS